MGEFMTIGPATVGEGDVAGFDIEGAKIGVARVAGSLYAFSAVCTHQGCPLAEMGELDGKELECECHGSVFDMTTGAVVEGPAEEPEPTFPVRDEGGELQIEV